MAKKKSAQIEDSAGSPLVRVLSDLPLHDRTGLAFQFDEIARTLAEVAWHPENQTPFTVVIKGGWGRGKTTLMRQIQRQLRESEAAGQPGRREVHSIWFNVWKYPDEEKVLAGLLGKLIESFETGGMLDQLKLRVDEHKESLARVLLQAAAPGVFGGELKGRYDPVHERRAFLDTFESLFQQLVYLRRHGWAAVRDLKGRDSAQELAQEQETHALAVFLDDLDRCSDSRVLEVLEAIYRFQDMPGVCFYLGLDWTRLTRILENRLDGRQAAFLEKIVQLAYDLPPVSEDGATGFIAELLERSGLAKELDKEASQGLRQLAASLEKHPRHLKRFLNDLSLRLGVLRNTNLLTGGAKEEDGHVSRRQLLAVHALGWILTGDDEAIVKDVLQLRDFLRDCEAMGDQRPDKISERAFGLHRDQGWIFETLIDAARDDAKLGTLVHHGSPSPPARGVESAVGPQREERPLSVGDPEWVRLEGGSFVMGDRTMSDTSPEHKVTVETFDISKFPVTNAQYALYVKGESVAARVPSHWSDGVVPEGLADHPVANVSWEDAVNYCRWLTRETQKRTHDQALVITLPTEAQWEDAARGEKGCTYPWGEAAPTDDLANFGDNLRGTTPVTRYRRGATAEGVWDLAGNVWEWCLDDWHDNYGGAPDNGSAWVEPPKRGARRVLRGGAFNSEARFVRAAYRFLNLPQLRNRNFGFRVVCVSGGQT